MEFAALGCLLANLLALFLSVLAAWQSSSNQGLAFLFGNGEVLGILSTAISSNVLENMAILSSASLNKLWVISVIHWSWNASHLAFLKFHFGTLSGTGWSDVFAVIMMGWWSLPNLSDEIYNLRILDRFCSHLNCVLLHHIQHKQLFLYTNSWYVQISGIENIFEGWECMVVFLFSGIQYWSFLE